MTSHCTTWHDTTQAITSHQMTWPSHDLTPEQTSRHQNTSLQSTKHHHHGRAEGSFTAKKWFGHRAGRSPCAHSIGKFFLCYIVLFLLETSAPGLSGHYWYTTNCLFSSDSSVHPGGHKQSCGPCSNNRYSTQLEESVEDNQIFISILIGKSSQVLMFCADFPPFCWHKIPQLEGNLAHRWGFKTKPTHVFQVSRATIGLPGGLNVSSWHGLPRNQVACCFGVNGEKLGGPGKMVKSRWDGIFRVTDLEGRSTLYNLTEYNTLIC